MTRTPIDFGAAERAKKDATNQAVGGCIGALLAVFVVLPLLATFLWNTGICALAHVPHIHSYWTAVAVGLIWSSVFSPRARGRK